MLLKKRAVNQSFSKMRKMLPKQPSNAVERNNVRAMEREERGGRGHEWPKQVCSLGGLHRVQSALHQPLGNAPAAGWEGKTFVWAGGLISHILVLRRMNKLNFYHQQRGDGGLRTGVELNDERVLENFQEGHLPRNSALNWFVDIRCKGEDLPSEPEKIREWLLARQEAIQSALVELANELRVGIDNDWPLVKPVPSTDRTAMAIYCSAIRRLSGREISEVLSNLAAQWPDLIQNLASYQPPILANG